MALRNFKTGLFSSVFGLTLSSLPALAHSVTPHEDHENYFAYAIASLVGIGIGAYVFSQRERIVHTDNPKRYLAAIERISQGFTQFLTSYEDTTPRQAIEWLLNEAALTLNIERISLWTYDKDHLGLTIRYCYDSDTEQNKLGIKINRADHKEYFAKIRGERTVPFPDIKEDDSSRSLLNLIPHQIPTKSLLVAHIGAGKQAIGTLHIISREKKRLWSDSDRQFAGSIADLIAFYLSNRDLSSTERALSSSEERFRDLVDASSDWYWETGPDHRLTYLSDQFTKLTGIPQNHLLGKAVHDFSDLSQLPPNRANHWYDLQANRPFRNYVYTQRYQGRALFISINGKPHFDETGKFLGYRGTGSDITETTTYRNRFDEGINALSNGFVMWDAEDRLVLWNNTAMDMFPSMSDYVTQIPELYRNAQDL